ncbi:MAG: NifB/NifX family molybdenum-iron cluster-binding protein [Desulfitobacteriaceae bacterium]
MTIKVAVVSSDGKYINEHFGRTKQFLVFEIKDDNYEFYELRKNAPPCYGQGHNEDLMLTTIEMLSDCQAILVSQIGQGAIERLALHGIKAYVIPDFIDDALKRLITIMKTEKHTVNKPS